MIHFVLLLFLCVGGVWGVDNVLGEAMNVMYSVKVVSVVVFIAFLCFSGPQSPCDQTGGDHQ